MCVGAPLSNLWGRDCDFLSPFGLHRTAHKNNFSSRACTHTHARRYDQNMLDINLLRPEKGGDPVRIIFVVAAKERVYLFPLSLSLSLSLSFDASWRKKRRRTHRWILIYSLSLTHTHTHTLFLSLGNIHAGYRERVAKTPV